MWGRDVRPLRSASFARSVIGIGTNTAFSGFGKTPTGELYDVFVEEPIPKKNKKKDGTRLT